MAESAGAKLELIASSGKRAIDAIQAYGRNKVLRIHSVSFNTSLKQAQYQCFPLAVDMTLGETERYKFERKECLDVNFVNSFGRSISEEIFPGMPCIFSCTDRQREG